MYISSCPQRSFRPLTISFYLQCVSSVGEMLKQLVDVNRAMDNHPGESRNFVRARHQEILDDLREEFKRLRTSIGQAQDTAELLSGANLRWGGAGGAAEDSGNGNGATASALLRERGMISAGMAAMDGVIGQANAIAGSLTQQGSLLDNVGRRVGQVGHKMPLVNGILNAIRRKKSKDALILSFVTAICLVFVLLYASR